MRYISLEVVNAEEVNLIRVIEYQECKRKIADIREYNINQTTFAEIAEDFSEGSYKFYHELDQEDFENAEFGFEEMLELVWNKTINHMLNPIERRSELMELAVEAQDQTSHLRSQLNMLHRLIRPDLVERTLENVEATLNDLEALRVEMQSLLAAEKVDE